MKIKLKVSSLISNTTRHIRWKVQHMNNRAATVCSES